MRKISVLLSTTIIYVGCAIWIFSSCSPETQDEFGDDYVARLFDKAIKELPDQNIPWDLCGAWERAEDISECFINTKALMINPDGKLSGIEHVEWSGGREEDISFIGLCYYDLKNLMWAYRIGVNTVSTDEFNKIIYWDSEALIIGESFCCIFSRDGSPIDSKILSNRDSRLLGKWKVIGNESRIVFNSDGTGSFNGSRFNNWCTIGEYILTQYTDGPDYLIDAYRFDGDILQLESVDPTYQDWENCILSYARE